jgi:hypothetical protein
MTHLYVMRRDDAADILKIGRSCDPDQRAYALQAGHAFNVRVLAELRDCGHLEAQVHRALDYCRISNREWFREELPTVLHAIAGVVRGQDARACPSEASEDSGDCSLQAATLVETDTPASASSASCVRKRLAARCGVGPKEAAEELERRGFCEVHTVFIRPDGVRTSKRVYRRQKVYASVG